MDIKYFGKNIMHFFAKCVALKPFKYLRCNMKVAQVVELYFLRKEAEKKQKTFTLEDQ